MPKKIRQTWTKCLDPLLFIFLVLLFLPARPAQGTEPISLEILLDGVPTLGGGWVLTLTLQALVDLDHAEIRIVSSKGLKRGTGEPFWQGALDAGDEEVLETAYNLTNFPPQEITIRVRGRSPDGRTFEKVLKRQISGESR